MELHITNTEAARLAAQLAKDTGRPVDDIVLEALRKEARERLSITNSTSGNNEDKDNLVRDLMAIAEHCSKLPVYDARTLEDMLYDEHGLPK